MEKEVSHQEKRFDWKWPLAIVCIVLIVVVATIVGTRLRSGKTTSVPVSAPVTEPVQSSVSSSQVAAPVEQVKKIYYKDSDNLYSINPTDKKIEEIDTGLANSTSSVLMSFDQLKVVYVKDGEVWLKQDGSAQESIDQVAPNKSLTIGEYEWIVTGWSSDSKNFVYSVSFSCGMGGDGCSASDEDTDATGVFWYSLASNKSTKLPIAKGDYNDSWIPNSSKVVYMELVDDVNYLKTYDVLTKKTATLTSTGWAGLQPQFSFSDDGTKLIYAYGDSNGGTTASRIIIANADNSDQHVQKQGDWAEYQWPKFIPGSTSDFVYSQSEKHDCSDGHGTCPRKYLYSVIGGKTTKVVEIISNVVGFVSGGQAITLRGYAYDAPYTRTISLVNLLTSTVTDLHEGKGSLYLELGAY